jgi:hypothetical protein
MTPVELPVWAVESSAILVARSACGDETALTLGQETLPEDAQQRFAERHSHQVSSMMETRTTGE